MLLSAEASASGATWFGVAGPRCPIDGPWCPGCGLTRSAAMAVQGDLPGAVAAHAAGPVVVLLLLVGLLTAAHAWLRGGLGPAHLRLARLGRLVLLAALAGAWAFRVL